MTVSITDVKLAGGNGTNGTAGSIRGEFGTPGPVPVYFSAYARGAANNYVPAGQGDAGYGKPAIVAPYLMGAFRNQQKGFVFNDVVSSNLLTGYSLYGRATAAGWSGTIPLIANVTVNSGVYITNVPSNTGFFAHGSYPAGSKLTLVNNGTIIGGGGNGGAGGTVSGATLTNGAAGGIGGAGMKIDVTASITNNSIIAGGGGGGGGGGSAVNGSGSKGATHFGGGGGGGGGGRAIAPAGAGGAVSGHTTNAPGSSGSAGTLFNGGSGGAGGTYSETYKGSPAGVKAGAGGTAGTAASPGSSGSLAVDYSSRSAAGLGGAAGVAVVGNANITWVAIGTRLGAIT